MSESNLLFKLYNDEILSGKLAKCVDRTFLRLGRRDLREESAELAESTYFSLKEKYIDTGKLTEEIEMIKTLYGIGKINVRRYISKKIDEDWFRSLGRSDRLNGLKPPSYFWYKKYRENNKEKCRENGRNYYQKNREKEIARHVKNGMVKYWKLKKDPEKYKEFLLKKSLADKKREEEKRLGIWVDKRKKLSPVPIDSELEKSTI